MLTRGLPPFFRFHFLMILLKALPLRPKDPCTGDFGYRHETLSIREGAWLVCRRRHAAFAAKDGTPPLLSESLWPEMRRMAERYQPHVYGTRRIQRIVRKFPSELGWCGMVRRMVSGIAASVPVHRMGKRFQRRRPVQAGNEQ